MVLAVCIVAGVFLGLADFGFTKLVEQVFMP
jgi:preprotein translocase subunit SecE